MNNTQNNFNILFHIFFAQLRIYIACNVISLFAICFEKDFNLPSIYFTVASCVCLKERTSFVWNNCDNADLQIQFFS